MATEGMLQNLTWKRAKRVSVGCVLRRLVIAFQRLTCSHDYEEFSSVMRHRFDTKQSVRIGVGVCNMCGNINTSLDSSFEYWRVVPSRH